MKRILVSFIGTGKKAEGSESQQYEKTIYKLPDGKVEESPLIISVLFKYLNPDKTIVIGTTQSIWAELSQILPAKLERDKIYEDIWEETWSGQVSEITLKNWENLLRMLSLLSYGSLKGNSL